MKRYTGRILFSRFSDAMRIGTKIFILVFFLLALLGMVAGVSIWQMHKIGVEIEGIAQRDIPLTGALTQITINQLEQSISFERAFRAGEVMKEHAGSRKEFAKAVRRFRELNPRIDVEFGEVKAIARHNLDNAVTEEGRQEFQSVLTMLDILDKEHKDYNPHFPDETDILSSEM